MEITSLLVCVYFSISVYADLNSQNQIHIPSTKSVYCYDDNWSALPDLNRSPVSDEAFVLLRELSRQCLEEIQRGRTATTRQLLSMLAEVRG